MGFMDRLLTGGKGSEDDLLNRRGSKNTDEPGDGVQSVTQLYGLAADAPTPDPVSGPGPPAQPALGSTPAGASTLGSTDSLSAPGAGGPAPEGAPTSNPSGSPDSPSRSDSLEQPLRDLFAQAEVKDPHLSSLLARVEDVDVKTLASELRDFARALGAEGAGRSGES